MNEKYQNTYLSMTLHCHSCRADTSRNAPRKSSQDRRHTRQPRSYTCCGCYSRSPLNNLCRSNRCYRRTCSWASQNSGLLCMPRSICKYDNKSTINSTRKYREHYRYFGEEVVYLMTLNKNQCYYEIFSFFLYVIKVSQDYEICVKQFECGAVMVSSHLCPHGYI